MSYSKHTCRRVDEASFKKLERLFDMAMSDPMSEPDAQPRALIKARNKVCLAGGLLARFFDGRQKLLEQHLTSGEKAENLLATDDAGRLVQRALRTVSDILPTFVHVSADL